MLSIALVEGGSSDTRLQGYFYAPVRHSDAVWAIDQDTGVFTAEFEKIKDGWWNCFLKGDACIDTTLIDSTQVWVGKKFDFCRLRVKLPPQLY